jgi:tRNA threonylcarbamoyladenosine biosynthesis protein TsaB
MHRGHQERLAPLVAEALAASGADLGAVGRIGVTTGPGSFTGLRVGLAFAKGLAIARGVPCVGVTTLQALAASVEGEEVLAAIDAKRDQVYLQLFASGAPAGDPEAVALADTGAWLERRGAGRGLTVVGSGAPLLAGLTGRSVELAAPDPVAIARLAMSAPDPAVMPAPLYLRAPDARLPA